jgi:hypothetical protein
MLHDPPNPFFAAHADQRLATLEVATQVDAVAPPLYAIRDRLEKIERTLANLIRDDVDYVTALYAAAIDTSGIVVDRTNAGRWIIDSWCAAKQKPPEPTICDIALLAEGKKVSAARAFLNMLYDTRDRYPGLPERLERDDLRRFISLAPGVCEAIRQSAPPPADPDKDVD